jgi:hypothetical protein
MTQDTSSPTPGKGRRQPQKPAKPYPDFPLYAHSTRRWAKKIRGKLSDFGPWEDPDGALKKYVKERDDLFAGRAPRSRLEGGLLLEDLLNRFLAAKQGLLDSGELAQRTWDEYHSVGEALVSAFGKDRPVLDLQPEDFEQLRSKLAARLGPVALGNTIQRVRTVFKYAYDATLVDAPSASALSSAVPVRRRCATPATPRDCACSTPATCGRPSTRLASR